MKSLADDWNDVVAWFSSDARIAAGIFVLALVTFSWFNGGAGWNQGAHFDLTRAIVERGTLYIDGYEGNTGDVSRGTGGHVYINKPPGVSLLAVVPYAVIYAMTRPSSAAPRHLLPAGEGFIPLPPGEGGRRPGEGRIDAQWLTTATTCGVCGALIGPTLFLYGRRHTCAKRSLLITLTILFGTIVLPYSTMLFAHVPAALFLLLAVVHMRERPLVAGVAAGIATICFYVCAPAALLIAILRRSRRFMLGAAPFALLLAGYQWLCFGSPFRTSVEASTPFTEKGLLFGVLRFPRLDALYGITLSPYRGLFFASPVLLFAIAGMIKLRRDREVQAVIGCTLIFFIAIASFNWWNGGWAFGPRYVLPIVPMLAIPTFAMKTSRLFVAAAIFSIATNFLATAVDAMPSHDIRDPIFHYIVPAFFSDNSVALPYGATNLGELAFSEGSRASVLPIALWMLGGTAVLTSAASKRA
jgi:hypothetical protein